MHTLVPVLNLLAELATDIRSLKIFLKFSTHHTHQGKEYAPTYPLSQITANCADW